MELLRRIRSGGEKKDQKPTPTATEIMQPVLDEMEAYGRFLGALAKAAGKVGKDAEELRKEIGK